MALVRKKIPEKVSHPESIDPTAMLKRLEMNGLLKLPVDVHAVAEYLGLDVKEEAMEDELSGFIEPRNGGWAIGINAFHHPNRQRFTIAHEIGHFLLHKPREKHVDITFARRTGGKNRIENEADSFAAKLLMPEAAVRQLVASGQTSLESLAAYFRVSVMAAKYRVQSLGFAVR